MEEVMKVPLLQWFNGQPVPVRVAALIGSSVTLLAVSILVLSATLLYTSRADRVSAAPQYPPVYVPSTSYGIQQPQNSGTDWFSKMRQNENQQKLDELYRDKQNCTYLNICK